MPELIHTFRLPVPIDRAWAALDDPDLVASAFPGAGVRERGADDVSGLLSVKVGPVRAVYDGTVRVTWRDRPARRFVLEATGDEVDGRGTLQATIHVTLSETDGGLATEVELRTMLAVTGRVAQFGDAVLGDVLDRHVQGLAAGLVAGGIPDAPPRPDLPEWGRTAVQAFAEPGAERDPGPEPTWSDDDLAAAAREAGPEPTWSDDGLAAAAREAGPEPTWSDVRLPSAAHDLDEPDPLELRELPAEELPPRRVASSLPPPPPAPPAAAVPPPLPPPPPPPPAPVPEPEPAPEPEVAAVEPAPEPEPGPGPGPEPEPKRPTAPAAPPLPPPPPPPSVPRSSLPPLQPLPPPTEVLSWSPPRRHQDPAAPPPAPAAPVLRPDRPVARVALRKPSKPTRATPASGGPTRPAPAIVPPSEPPPPSSPAPLASEAAPADASPPPPSLPPPALRPAPKPAPVVLSRPPRPTADAAVPAEDTSLAAKAAPYAIVLLLLWILRRMFGSDDR